MTRRLCDILFALFWLALLAPVMVLIAILVRWDSPGSILYAPRMVGHGGRLFHLWRFRTLFADKTIAAAPDERLTRLGRILRTYSLDHLPMLLNLLGGSLTLVGPRPMEPEVVDLTDPDWQRYFQVKPGLLNHAVLQLGNRWTSSRSSRPSLNQELELEYIARQSLRLDLAEGWAWACALVASRGNVKARGVPLVPAERELDIGEDIE